MRAVEDMPIFDDDLGSYFGQKIVYAKNRRSMPHGAAADKARPFVVANGLSTAIAVSGGDFSAVEGEIPAMPFRFVHTADVHLDSPLRTLALREPELAELIGGATRKAFVAVINLCLAEQVDALLIAGDLYDGEQTSMKTARFLADELRRLHEAGIKTFVIRGNHDAESRITKELTLPDSVTVFTGHAKPALLSSGGLDIAVHGVSFRQKHAPESLLPSFRPPQEGAVNIGMLHTSLGGSALHDRYAPCTVSELHGHGFHYWALGHVHQRFVDRGRATIVMPGNPQGRDVNEAGPKSATLVRIGDDRAIAIEQRPTSVAEFQRLPVDLTGVDNWRAALARIEGALEPARLAARSEHLVARLSLTGATTLAWRLRADADKLAEDARAIGAAIGKSWIDKIELGCTEPRAQEAAASSDPLAELRALIDGEVARSKAFLDSLRELAEDLSRNLPAGSREDLLGRDADEFASILADIASDGAENVLAHLRADSERGP
jgi:DNA repair exonuclease SbcCD nuclease subunit